MLMKLIGFVLVFAVWASAGFVFLVAAALIRDLGIALAIITIASGVGLWFVGRWLHDKFKLGPRVMWWTAAFTLLFALALSSTGHFIELVLGLIACGIFIAHGIHVRKKVRAVASAAGSSDYWETPVYSSNPVVANGQRYIHRLDRLHPTIDNDRIKGQVAHLQAVGTQILDYIEANPDCAHKTDLFMDFYLPKTVELLEEYASFSRQAVKSQNIQDAMSKISGSVARMEQVFEHSLNNLYGDRVLDISGDIETLEQMMILEGLE